jgi:hypothetical protein
MRGKGAYDIRTRGSRPHKRSNIRTQLAILPRHFQLAGREESIYGYMTASILFRVAVRLSLDTGGGSIYVNLLHVNMTIG